jgi:NifU-like protein involved in Fe-S cluster formation
MRSLFLCIVLMTLAGCGAELATTAATTAALKKQELEQAKKTKEMMQRKIDAATQQMHQSAGRRASDAGVK